MNEVAYITSGKIGLHRFTYNELLELEKLGIPFILCLTQLKNGPWMPEDRWKVLTASKVQAIKESSLLFIHRRQLALELYHHAKENNVVKYLMMALSMYPALKAKKISSLHCQMGDKKLYIGFYLKRLLGVPLTATIHAHELYQRSVYDKPQEIRQLFSACDEVITISDFNAKLISENLGVAPSRIKVMRLFAEIDYLHKVIDKAKILIVANWAEKKGFRVLIDAVKGMKRNDFVVWVVGGTYFSDNSIDVEQIVKDNQIEERFAILGRIGGVTLDIVFSSCDIFCLPSYTELYSDGKPAEREGIPVALMEAMAWGKPVITTRHAGIPELVDQILVEERSVKQLQEALNYMLDNRDKWAEMGKANQSKLAEKFSKDNVRILGDTFRQWQK